MTHDYKRHGTTTLFAALDVATGKVIGQCMKRHRHQEWLKFLRRIDAETPKHLDVHLIACGFRRKSARHSDLKSATDSDLKPATCFDPSRPPIPI